MSEQAEQATLSAKDSLQTALGYFQTYMRDEGFAINTSKAFASDIRLLGQFLGVDTAVNKIGTKDLNDFLLNTSFGNHLQKNQRPILLKMAFDKISQTKAQYP